MKALRGGTFMLVAILMVGVFIGGIILGGDIMQNKAEKALKEMAVELERGRVCMGLMSRGALAFSDLALAVEDVSRKMRGVRSGRPLLENDEADIPPIHPIGTGGSE